MFCKFCGKELPDDTQFCSYCGKQLYSTSSTEIPVDNKKSKSGILPIISILVLLLLVILIVVLIRSCGRNNIIGIWAYDLKNSENTADTFYLSAFSILHFRDDGSVETSAAASFLTYSIDDNKLKIMFPLGDDEPQYFDFKIKGDSMTLSRGTGDIAVFKKFDSVKEAIEYEYSELLKNKGLFTDN